MKHVTTAQQSLIGRSQRPFCNIRQVSIIYNCSMTLLTQVSEGRCEQMKTAPATSSASDYLIPFT